MAAELRAVARPTPDELTALLDGVATSIVWLDGDGAVVHLNEPAEDLFGVSRNQAMGRAVRDLLKSNTELEGVVSRARAAGAQYSRREIPFEAGPGAPPRVLDVTVTPFDPPGRSGGVLVELADTTHHQRITRENALLTQLGGSRAMVRQLAHEIKNPLGGIRGAAQLLARELPDAALRDYTDVIIAEADRLRSLVDRMLGSNKLLALAPTNIHEVLERVASLIEAESQQRIQFVRDYDPSLPDVLIDREQMIQAVLNIARTQRRCQAAGEARRIVLRTRALRQFTIGHTRHRLVVGIEIIDNGPGIPAELQETLFYPMVSGRPDGTGLGLAITQNIINQHQGLVECESHPGHTLFAIVLPLDQGAAPT